VQLEEQLAAGRIDIARHAARRQTLVTQLERVMGELDRSPDIRPGGGVLMYGPPGTGKTMLAKATAGEIDATFFRISPADVLSKWVGEAEQNIKKLFDAASAERRSIIFIDEIEALVPARRDEGSSVIRTWTTVYQSTPFSISFSP